MNRMITTAGLAALGAASVAPTLAQDAMLSQKPWAVGAALRGFWDDNYFTYPGTPQLPKLDTFGFEVAPSAAYNIKRGEQTTLGVSYLYTFRYFVDRPRPRDDNSHQANLKLTHNFNERFSLDVKDSFVMAQEPSIIDPTISTTLPARAEGNNTRNTGTLQVNAAVVENFSITAGYSNSIYDYEQDSGSVAIGSRSATLDRMEHLMYADGNYQILPKTTISLGYQFGYNDYTSRDPIYFGISGDVRDSKSHFASVGIKQHLNPQIDISAKGGIQYSQYDSPLFDDETNPYVEGSARWAYMPGSALQVGVRHQRVPTDVRLINGTTPVADAEATSVYVSVTHAVTAKISAIAMAQYQHTVYGGSTPGAGELTDELFYGGVTLAYQFNLHIAAEIGYAYDRLDSDIPLRSFSRNRIFVGTRLSY